MGPVETEDLLCDVDAERMPDKNRTLVGDSRDQSWGDLAAVDLCRETLIKVSTKLRLAILNI